MAETLDPAPPHGGAYEVTAIRYGSLRARKSDLYYRFDSYGEPDGEVEMAYYFWLLRAGERVVLVDTGFRRETAESRGRTFLIDPLAALGELGVQPPQVETIVLTHLHYDHTGNLAAFPNAELIVPRRELEFWTGPFADRAQFAPHAERADVELIREAEAAGRVRLVEGEEEILPGVTAIEVGGHSPGQQVIVVDGLSGKVVLTSDAVHFYEELELERPFGVITDLEKMYLAFDRISELARAGATLVAGHDPAVIDRFAATGASAEPSVRVFGG